MDLFDRQLEKMDLFSDRQLKTLINRLTKQYKMPIEEILKLSTQIEIHACCSFDENPVDTGEIFIHLNKDCKDYEEQNSLWNNLKNKVVDDAIFNINLFPPTINRKKKIHDAIIKEFVKLKHLSMMTLYQTNRKIYKKQIKFKFYNINSSIYLSISLICFTLVYLFFKTL